VLLQANLHHWTPAWPPAVFLVQPLCQAQNLVLKWALKCPLNLVLKWVLKCPPKNLHQLEPV
jgi:hypothetical protein